MYASRLSERKGVTPLGLLPGTLIRAEGTSLVQGGVGNRVNETEHGNVQATEADREYFPRRRGLLTGALIRHTSGVSLGYVVG